MWEEIASLTEAQLEAGDLAYRRWARTRLRSGTLVGFIVESASGEALASGCDQQYVMNIDGSGMRRISNGLGRTTCGYFYPDGQSLLYASTHVASPDCPPSGTSEARRICSA